MASAGLTSPEILALVAAMGYDAHVNFASGDIAEAILGDKKVEGDSIDFVLPHGIGHCAVCRTPLADIGKVVADAV